MGDSLLPHDSSPPGDLNAQQEDCNETKSSEIAVPDLPTFDEILASTERLSAPDASAQVVRVRSQYAVKYGGNVYKLEADNLRFLGSHFPGFVPKVYADFYHAETGQTFIIMEHLEGETLESLWPSLNSAERKAVCVQIREIMKKVRALPEPGYIGSVHRQPCQDGVFFIFERQDPMIHGPFASEEDMVEGMLRKMAEDEPEQHITLLRKLLQTTLRGHKTVFTHGDLQPKNVMVRRKMKTGDEVESASGFEVKIIDWEMSGWYPEFWEHCNATICGRFKAEWLGAVEEILELWPAEYLMMMQIRHIVFY